MAIRFGPAALALVCTALFAAGCGSSDNSKSNSTPAASGTPASSTTSSSGGSSSSSANPQIQAAVAACKSSIDNNPAVKANIKSDLEGICDKAASGDATAVKKATKEVCLKIVESSVPAGAAQDQAKAACNTAG